MKIAIVTGASSGMGMESVMQIGDRFNGIDEIWVIARRKDRLKNLERSVPVPLRILGLDLTDHKDLDGLRQALDEEKPSVVFLINSAGYGKFGPVGRVDLSQEAGMVSLNCEALVNVTHLVLPYMAKNSRILQFASSAAFLPQPGCAIYSASKSFVLHYSRALREELRPKGIYVTAVCPGPVNTEFFDVAEMTGRIPIYKKLTMARPEKVVKKAITDSMMGKAVSVYGILMKAYWLLSKVAPHSLLLRVMAHITIEKEDET